MTALYEYLRSLAIVALLSVPVWIVLLSVFDWLPKYAHDRKPCTVDACGRCAFLAWRGLR